MADAVQRVPGVQVEVVDGGKGEFAVLVDGRPVQGKGEDMPSVEQVATAVNRAGQTASAP